MNMTAFNDTVYLDSDVPSGPDNLKADPNNPMPQVCKINKNMNVSKIRHIWDISRHHEIFLQILWHFGTFEIYIRHFEPFWNILDILDILDISGDIRF